MWEENDHIVLIRSDGSVVYEDGWEPEEDDDEFVTYCEVYDNCEECPAYCDTCDGREEEDE